MSEINEMDQTDQTDRVLRYEIGGRAFTVRPPVARQEKWIWPILKPLFEKGDHISADDILAMMTDSVVRLSAILLIPDGMNQAEKVRAGWAAVEKLEAWLDESISVSELGPVVSDFFTSGQQWKIFAGLASPFLKMMTGSMTPSASSPMETSLKPSGSGRTCDSPNPNAIGAVNGSEDLRSEPSLVSVGSGSRG